MSIIPLAIVIAIVLLVIYFARSTSTSNVVYVPAVDANGDATAVGVNVAACGTSAEQKKQVADTQAEIESCQLPPGIADGDVIRCSVTGAIARVVGCKKQWYPSMAVYQKHGSPAFREVPCGDYDAVAAGPNYERLTIGKRTVTLPMLAGPPPAAPRAPVKISEMSNLSSVFRR